VPVPPHSGQCPSGANSSRAAAVLRGAMESIPSGRPRPPGALAEAPRAAESAEAEKWAPRAPDPAARHDVNLPKSVSVPIVKPLISPPFP